MSAVERPVIRVVPGVCPIPCPDGPCGERARFYTCGWRCDSHKPGRRP